MARSLPKQPPELTAEQGTLVDVATAAGIHNMQPAELHALIDAGRLSLVRYRGSSFVILEALDRLIAARGPTR
jgi:hypothetical protein